MKSLSKKGKDSTTIEKQADPKRYLFFVYVEWSQSKRVMKTYIKTKNHKSERDMVCNGLSSLVANPAVQLNSKNIKMTILYRLEDDHDISKDFDVTGIVPTRLDHYLNSDPRQRINFSQKQIEDIVNKAEFTYRAIK